MTQAHTNLGKIKKHKKSERQARYLSQAMQLEEAGNPHIIQGSMVVISIAIVGFLVWAGLTNVNEVARTPGEVVPYGHQQTIQHLEGGIIKQINVLEGQTVEAGQTLITMDDAVIRKDLERAQAKQLSLDLQAERLRAFVDGRQPDFSAVTKASPQVIADQMAFFTSMTDARITEGDIIRDQIAEKKQALVALETELAIARENLNIARDVYTRREALNKKGYASDIQLLQDKKGLNDLDGDVKRLQNRITSAQSVIDEYNNRLQSLDARHRDEAYEKLAAIDSEKSQNIEIISKLDERIARLNIRAPERGLVKGLAVNTVGGVIQPGQVLMEIVPLDKTFEVQVKISPRDIGHLDIGQRVQVKFSTYDFSRYGSVHGRLEHISATTFSGDNGERYYQGRVMLDQNYVGQNPANVVMPGMTVMADIITGDKTILQYMLKPIHIAMRNAFSER